MEHRTEKIAVVIPCYNEEKAIAQVIKKFPHDRLAKYDFDIQVYVVDNNSTDRTAEVATEAGAVVMHESKKGKGNAMRFGFRNLPDDIDYVAMLDGDDTYSPKELLRMVEPLHNGFCDVVIGSRLGGKIHGESMTVFNRFGNWLFTHLVRYVYRANVTDVLTGYFAWKKEVIDRLHPHLVSNGFAIEMEMITKMSRMGFEIYSVPITYTQRAGETNLNPMRDGARIMSMFIRNLSWKPGAENSEDKALRRKKIVFVSDAIYLYNKGGKEKRLYEISTRLAAKGNDVHIYTMHWWHEPAKTKTENGLTLHAISKFHPLYKGDRRSISEGILFGFACLKLIFVRFDVLDVDHMPFFPVISAWVICKLRGKKLYGTWHEALSRQDWTSYMGQSGLIAAMIEHFTIRLPNTITAASPQTLRLLAEYHKRDKRVRLVASGIDTHMLQNVEPADIDCDVLYVGRLVKDKNIDQLIQAMAIVRRTQPKAKTIIIGQGVEKPMLQDLIDELELNEQVRIVDPLPNASDVYSYMKQAKVFVLPSVREGFGIVALEALGCGTPVITVNTPANAAKDLVTEGKTGSIVEPYDPKQLATAIKVWLKKSAKPEEVTGEVTDYDWDALVLKQTEVYAR